MPTDLKNFVESNRKKQDEILASVLASTKGDAARSMGKGVYVSGAIVALVAGVAIAL